MKLRKITLRGRPKWQLQWFDDGKRLRRYFDSEKAGKEFAGKHVRERCSIGAAWAAVGDRERSDIMAAQERAKLGGYTLSQACDAIEKASARHKVTHIEIRKAVYGFLESKKAQNLKPFTLDLMESSLIKLADYFPSTPLDEISVHDVERYLDDRKGSPKSRRNWIGEAAEFFGWCLDRRYVLSNPAATIKKPIVTTLPLAVMVFKSRRKMSRT